MSSSCPPQLQLSIQPNTTSFKRSFEQFGFDLGSPVDGAAASSNNGNDRNKRARSASSFSDSNVSMDSSHSSTTLSSGSTSSSTSGSHRQGGGTTEVIGSAGGSLGPPRLPTPEIQDIEMPDYPEEGRSSISSFQFQQHEENFRLSLERYNAFDSQIAVLRQSRPTSPPVAALRSRLSTPPPILPPIELSSEQPRLSLSSGALTYLPPPPDLSTPLTQVLFADSEEPDDDDSSAHSEDLEVVQGFQARLSGALERLHPQSPLVPGFSLDDHEEEQGQTDDATESEEDPEESDEFTPDPPTLPPIPSDTNIVHFSLEDLLSREPTGQASSTMAEVSNSPSTVSPTLGEHPLPSPILRDLHNWIDERQPSTDSDSSSTLQVRGRWVPNPEFAPERQSIGQRLTSTLDNFSQGALVEQLRRSGPQFLDNLWERRSVELWNNTTDEAPGHSLYNPPSVTPQVPSSFENFLDRSNQLEPRRHRNRIGSSNSLVTESAMEARRRADHDELIRPANLRPPWWTRDTTDAEMSTSISTEGEGESSRRRSSPRFTENGPPPYFLQLPPLPAPSFDVSSDDRVEEERPAHEYVIGRQAGRFPPAASPSLHGVFDWRRREDQSSSIPSRLPVHSIPTSVRDRMASSSPLTQRPPTSPLLSPLGNIDIEFFPTANVDQEPEHITPLAPNSRFEESEERRRRLQSLMMGEMGNDVGIAPWLPPPDLGNTFDSHEQGGLVGPFRDQHRPNPRSFRSDDVPASTFTLQQHRPPLAQRVGSPQLQQSWHNPNITPSNQQTHPLTIRHRPRPAPPVPTSESGSLDDWRHQTFLQLERNRQQIQVLNERQRNLEHFFHRRSSRTMETEHTIHTIAQQPSSQQELNPSPTRSLPLSAARPNDGFPIELSEYSRSRYEEPPRNTVNVNMDTASSTTGSLRPLILVEERPQNRNSIPPYSTPALDPETFAPGPFRNTIMHPRLNRRVMHSRPSSIPPLIPPLPFQHSNPVYPQYPSSTQPNTEEDTTRRHSLPPQPQADPFSAGLSRRTSLATEERTLRRTTVSRGFIGQPTAVDTAPSERVQSDLHRYLTTHVRMEPSRLAQPNSLHTSDANRPQMPSSYMEPMRPDSQNALRQLQLMQFHQQGLERRRTQIISTMRSVDTPEGESTSNSGPTARRFGGMDTESQYSWARRRRLRNAVNRFANTGDFVHDDDFDDSYEGLLNLAATLGDAKPKSTPSEVLENLVKGTYKDWKTADGDKRCPICLDDYTDNDQLLKLNNCTHWLHYDCLHQWLHTANTCPVCRESVQTPGSSNIISSSNSAPRRHHFHRLPHMLRRGPPANGAANNSSPTGGWASAFRGSFD